MLSNCMHCRELCLCAYALTGCTVLGWMRPIWAKDKEINWCVPYSYPVLSVAHVWWLQAPSTDSPQGWCMTDKPLPESIMSDFYIRIMYAPVFLSVCSHWCAHLQLANAFEVVRLGMSWFSNLWGQHTYPRVRGNVYCGDYKNVSFDWHPWLQTHNGNKPWATL